MINLLPEQKKKIIEKEYKFRVAVLTTFFILLIAIMAVVLLVPSYFLALYREQAASSRVHIDQSPEEIALRESLDTTLKSTKVLMTVLNPDIKKIQPSTLVDIITKHKTASVHINEIIYEREKSAEEPYQLTVRGLADSRQSLLAYTTSLRKENLVGALDLPVSNFAKDTDIEFSFVIKGAQ